MLEISYIKKALQSTADSSCLIEINVPRTKIHLFCCIRDVVQMNIFAVRAGGGKSWFMMISDDDVCRLWGLVGKGTNGLLPSPSIGQRNLINSLLDLDERLQHSWLYRALSSISLGLPASRCPDGLWYPYELQQGKALWKNLKMYIVLQRIINKFILSYQPISIIANLASIGQTNNDLQF